MSIPGQREPTNLVRLSSEGVEQRVNQSSPAHPLEEALIRERNNLDKLAEPWKALLGAADLPAVSENAITFVVSRESKRLRNIWRSYQVTSPAEDRIDLDGTDPTVEGMTDIINQALASWNKKRRESWHGRIKAKFHSFCGLIHSHSTLLEVLPSASEYVSVFYGTLTAIIRASITHEGIVEDTLEALCDISKYTNDCATDLKLYQTEEMEKHIADLYSDIFSFLGDASEWIMARKRKRFSHSFNENLRDEYQDKIKRIQAKSQIIKDQAAQSARVEGRLTRLAVEGVSVEVRAAELIISQQLRDLKRELGEKLLSHLQDHSVVLFNNQQLRETGGLSLADILPLSKRTSPLSEVSVEEAAQPGGDNQIQLVVQSQHLIKFFQRDRIRLAAGGFYAMNISASVIVRLSEWVQADTPDSSFLWLQGWPATLAEDTNNPISMLAAKFLETASEIGRPPNSQLFCASYFCHLRREEPHDDDDDEKEANVEIQATVALVYALLWQIITELLVPPPAPSVDISGLGLQGLDGTLLTWDAAMKVFRSLQALVVPGSLCVIDGLHWLDNPRAEPLVMEIIGTLRQSKLKVLFTTSARSGALLEALSNDETVRVEDDVAGVFGPRTRPKQ